MVFVEQTQKEDWNEFLIRNSGSFLQSFEWGEFQKSLNRKVWRLSNEEFQALIIQHKLPFGKSYLYCPRGPVTKGDNNWRSNLQDIISQLKEVRPSEIKNAIFLRIDPELEDTKENQKILEDLGFQKSPKEIQPKQTLILDITKPEKELLAQMAPKTRYNIRLAEKHGIKIQNPKSKIQNNIKIQNSNNQNLFESFWRLMQETAKRDKFHPHPKEYYQKMLEIFEVESPILGGSTSGNYIPIAKLFLAKYENKIIAANIVIFFGKRATYLHGASDYNFRNLMAPYLLQWEQMKEAKKLGCAEYDFWGIDEKKWPGITRFKEGFCGENIRMGAFGYPEPQGEGCAIRMQYVGAWDFVFDKNLYTVNKLLTKIRQMLR